MATVPNERWMLLVPVAIRATLVTGTMLLAGGAAGCYGPDATLPMYRPGRDMVITYEGQFTEQRRGGWGFRMQHTDRVELPVAVTPSSLPGHVGVEMTIRRIQHEGPAMHGGVFDSAQRPPKGHEGHNTFPAWLEALQSIRFVGQMDSSGRIVRFDASGQPFDEIDRLEIPDDVDVPDHIDRTDMLNQTRLTMRRSSSAVYRRAIDSSTAYLPRPAMTMGSRWHIDRVLPSGMTSPLFIHEYATYLILQSYEFRERATCRLDRIDRTLGGRMAVVVVRVRRDRVPDDMHDKHVRDVCWMEGEGTLRYDLTTATVERLRIRWTFHAKPDKVGRGSLIETLSVKPAR